MTVFVRCAATLALLLFVPVYAQAADPLRVAKPSAIGFGFSLLDVGIEAGIFTANGLTIEPIFLEGAAKEHQAMAAGAVDVTLGSGPEIAYIAKGSLGKAVAAIAGPPLNFVAMVRNDGKINSVADLKGKRISASTVGSITWWFATQLSKREGWQGSDAMVIVPLGNFDAMRAALVTNSIDAISATLEGALLLESHGQGKLLISFGDFVKPFLTHAAYASNDVMQNHPDRLRRFLKGWFDTVAFMKSHKEEGVRLSMTATKLPKDISDKVYDAEMPMFFDNGHFDLAAIEVVKRSLLETGQLQTMPDNKDILTEAFLE